MDLERIEAVLDEALELRMPYKREDDRPPRQKIAELEDHLLRSAHLNGDLVEAQHWLRLLTQTLADQWAALEGWQVALSGVTPAKATKAQVTAAKIQVAPQLHAAGVKAAQLRASVDAQIERLEREERVCSRAYTMMSGG